MSYLFHSLQTVAVRVADNQQQTYQRIDSLPIGDKQDFDVSCEGPPTLLMDLSPFRQNFVKLRTRQIFYHSLKEHPLFSKFPKFGCKIL